MVLQILLSTAFLLLVLRLIFRVPLSDPQNPRHSLLPGNAAQALFIAALALALLMRLILGYCINGFDADIACFKAWAYYTHEVGLSNMYYSDFFLDYPPGYLYVLYLTEFFRKLLAIPDYS